MNKKILTFIISIYFFINICFSQDYLFTRYNVEDGLSQCVIKCIFQDSEGYIWFGTQNGLNKFNGYEFETFQYVPGDTGTISDGWIYSISEDAKKNLWTATRKGLNRYNKYTHKFISYKNISDNSTSIYNDVVSGVCFGKNGIIANTPPILNIYNETKNNFIRINTGLEYDENVPDENLPVITDKEGMIWIASKKGLAVYEPLSKKIIVHKNIPNDNNTISHDHITDLYEDKLGNIWIGTENGLNLYNKKKKKFKRFFYNKQSENSLESNFVSSIIKDKEGNLWVGTTGSGLYKIKINGNSYKFENFKNTESPSSISNNFVISLYIDRSNILWIGTFNGINKIDLKKKKFNIIKKSSSINSVELSDNVIASVFKENKTKTWIGTWGNGLNIYNNKTKKVKLFSTNSNDNNYKISNDFVHVIFRDKQQNFWIGTRNGIDIFDKNKNKFVGINEFFNLKNVPDFRNIRINHILTDHKENIWVATQNGLYKINIEKDSYIRFSEKTGDISDNLIYEILESVDKKIYIATMGGLDVYNPADNSFLHYRNNTDSVNSLCDNFTISLCEDSYGNIWIGTQSGVTRLNPDTHNFTYFTEKDGMAVEVIYEILNDNNNNIWIATGRGLYMFDTEKNMFNTYKIEDGLQSLEFNTACHKSKTGELFFGGMQGLNYFYPDSIKNYNYIAPIVITSLEKTNDNGKKQIYINQEHTVELTYKDFEFTIKFAALDYTNPKKNLYAYKMYGVSEKWINLDNRNFVSFTNLPPGKYIFNVKGTNSDGVWNKKEASITVIIAPPWWKTKYAYAIYLLTIICLIALIIRLREKKLISDKLVLERKVIERTEELTQQKEVIEKNHTEITDSINYASRIQNALLPSENILLQYFTKSFVFYRPKEIVSGDFYWFKKIKENIIFAVADCTGHGVPGAFVSMLGISFLNEIVRRTEIKKASDVLEEMRKQVKESLKQTGKYNDTKDGMDIALCSINTETGILQYAGAYNPLYIIFNDDKKNERITELKKKSKIKIHKLSHKKNQINTETNNKELIEIKANRQPIAIYAKEKPFTNNVLKLEKGDILYLFSDGYIDQFKEITEERYKSRRFKNLILSIADKPMHKQKQCIENEFERWKGNSEQIDDVLVIGVKV